MMARDGGSVTGDTARRMERVKNLVAAILTVGLGGAMVIYFVAQPPAANPLGYEFTDSKRYLRDMEMFGGKANILTSQFREWVGSLFQGRRLAFTVAFLTLALAFAVWLFASPLPPEPPGEAGSGAPGQG
jgi:hypothetical protein